VLNPAPKRNIFLQWFFWHFVEVPRELFGAWKNFLKFNFNYFSIGLLVQTLFSPWRADKIDYPRGFDFAQYFNIFFSNIISRCLGALVRLVFIAMGLIVGIFMFGVGIIILVFWFSLPFLIVFMFFYAIGIIL